MDKAALISANLLQIEAPSVLVSEEFSLESQRRATRSVTTPTGRFESSIHLAAGLPEDDPASAFEASWLRTPMWPTVSPSRGVVRVADLFSGCGGLSLGVWEAARALELEAEFGLAVDNNAAALATYKENFHPALATSDPIEQWITGRLGDDLSQEEKRLKKQTGSIDFLVGGPPCQGHSDLNNHTRRNDTKNLLYLKMARATEILQPSFFLVENVPGAVHDHSDVVGKTRAALHDLGYMTDSAILSAADFGVPQRRRRFFLVGSRNEKPSLDMIAAFRRAPRTLRWAIEDLGTQYGGPTFDTSANHSETNKQRIRYLFDHDLFELPNEQRPDCHRLKKHSYSSVYGRMRWDEPAPTITSGFGSTGQGRFVHPAQPRTLTPHEAARVQGIPDFFAFQDSRRTALQEMIGNAVPAKLAYVVAMALLTQS